MTCVAVHRNLAPFFFRQLRCRAWRKKRIVCAVVRLHFEIAFEVLKAFAERTQNRLTILLGGARRKTTQRAMEHSLDMNLASLAERQEIHAVCHLLRRPSTTQIQSPRPCATKGPCLRVLFCKYFLCRFLLKRVASRHFLRCQKADVYVFPKVIDWIPFGDHPLKLERYRED